jgi:hypothetical protein
MAYTTVNKSTDYFNTKLYTGNGSTQSITGVGFQPDWVWVKERSSTSASQVVDAVRGYNKRIQTSSDAGQAVDSSPYNDFKSFDSDGFSIGSGGAVNENSQTYAAWNWKANGAGSANTDGSINSTVSVNSAAGFSIVKYVGNGATSATVGHGLGVVPSMIIFKNLETTTNWLVYHKSLGNTHGLYLNGSDAKADNVDFFYDTSPTSSVWTMSNSTNNNQGSREHIAYCFAEKTGYSKFGSYVGNGNANGTFVYLGFKPAFLLMKRTNNAAHWIMYDNKRSTSSKNLTDKYFYASLSDAENTDTSEGMDFLSNGFKHRNAFNAANGSGDTFIYMAFASAPLVGSNNIPATAR